METQNYFQSESVSFRSEFKRSFQWYNLGVAFLASATLTLLAFFFFRQIEWLPMNASWGALFLFLGLFSGITFLHAMMHCYWGWRFEKGITASNQGDTIRALSLLTPIEWPRMNHYDPGNKALIALQQSRSSPDKLIVRIPH